MFNSLYGVITAKNSGEKNFSIYLDCGSIEWEIFVSNKTLDSLPSVGSTVRVYTWLQHKEDLVKLFGFTSAEERSVFLDLLSVEGVGPVAALKILSQVSGAEIVNYLESEDVAQLEKVAGKKTAQKMILKLKGKLVISSPNLVSKKQLSEFDELADALSSMGFDRNQALVVLTELSSETKTKQPNISKKELEQLIFKEAIVKLSSGL